MMLSYQMFSQVPERKGSAFDVGGEESGGMIRICELLRKNSGTNKLHDWRHTHRQLDAHSTYHDAMW